MRVLIASLHFSPAFLSHLVAYGKAFSALGYAVDFAVHPAYKAFSEFRDNESAFVSSRAGWADDGRYTLALFVNSAPGNHISGKALRKAGCKVWYLYHEPWETIGSYLQTESLPVLLKLSIAHQLSIRMLKACTGAILPSRQCVESYVRRDIRYNSNYQQIPLLFDDESDGVMGETRQYFSYIGNITKAHGFDNYMEFAKHAVKNGMDIRFLIASRRPFPDKYLTDELILKHMDRFTIQCGRPLSNAEINQCYARSICVWNLYRRSTQSGVFAKSMMFGTPVLASSAGSFNEFLTNGAEGRVLDTIAPSQIAAAYEDIRYNLEHYSAQCRQRFLETFYFKPNLGLIERL